MMGKLEEMLDKIDPGDAEKVREYQDYLRMRAMLKQARKDNDDAAKEIHSLHTQLAAVTAERDEARQWVRDLQSGMYINCVYCGHRYGPKDSTPASMADVLKQHIERCPQHPLSLVTVERDGLREACSAAWQDLHEWKQLAEYQREVIDQNRRACPTQAGIDKTSQVLNLISNALAATEPKGE